MTGEYVTWYMNGWSIFISRAAFNSLEIMLSRPTGLTLVQLKFSHGGYKGLLAFKQKNVKFGRYHESGLYKLGHRHSRHLERLLGDFSQQSAHLSLVIQANTAAQVQAYGTRNL